MKIASIIADLDLSSNWYRVILLVNTFVSFVPQFRRLWLTKGATGISLPYVLLHLLTATEHFMLFLCSTPIVPGEQSSVGDLLNLSQTGLAWAMCVIWFGLCLYYPSDYHRRDKSLVLVTYTAFLLTSVIPASAISIYQVYHPEEVISNHWLFTLFLNAHHIYINPIITFLGLPAAILQAREMSRKQALHALSLGGLSGQGHVFNVLAGNWCYRLNIDNANIYRFTLSTPWGWSQVVNWLAAGSGIFGVGQAYLLLLAHWRGVRREMAEIAGGKGEEEKRGKGGPVLEGF